VTTAVRGLPRRRGRTRVLLALAGLLPLAAGLLTLRAHPGQGARCELISVPAYFYPGAAWTRAIDSRPVPSVMILDITSTGAGSAADHAYQEAVRRAQAAGITVLGYATTGYARRPAAAVERDVRHYRAWYHVTGIFLDQAAAGRREIPYYRALTGYIRGPDPGAPVMLNPGTYPSRRYMSLGVVVLAFEGSYARYARLRVPRWVGRYPAARFAHVVYGTPGPRLAAVLRLARRRHAGYVYVTNLAGRNPYRSLPRYWAAEDADAAGMCQGPGRAGRSRRAGLLAGMALAGQGRGEQRPVDAGGDVG
jgi:hypothetical protein